MQITELSFVLPDNKANGRLLAYVTAVFDDSFLVSDIRLISGDHGYFLSMPDKRALAPCKECGRPCEYTNRFCSHCGKPFSADVNRKHLEVAYPINSDFRFYMETVIGYEFDKIVEHYI